MTATAPMLVHGEGPLAATLRRLLARRQNFADGLARVVVIRIDELDQVEQFMFQEPDVPVLLVGVWRSWVYIGPFWKPGTPGCPRCLYSRISDSPMGLDLNQPEWIESDSAPSLPTTAGPAASHMLAALVEVFLEGIVSADAHGSKSVLVYDTQTGEASDYSLTPDSTCSVCGPPARDTIPVFSESNEPLLKRDVLSLRLRDPDPEAMAVHVSPIGLFRRLRIDLQSPFGACSIELPETKGYRRNPALGRGISFAQSRALAVLEGLERHCGLHRGGKREVTRAAYRNVAARAIYPPSFGTHPDSSYERSDFKFQAFTPDTVIDWVEAYSFARKDAVLVPERAAFWGPRADGEPAFFQESSNGCAIGSCVEEATLHGLRELIERDSFLLTWYRKLVLPELDLKNDPDPELRMVLHKSELFTGCTFRAFASTMEHGVPSVWLTATGHDPDGPAVLAGAGSHLDLRQAVIGALYELAKRVLGITHYYPFRKDEARLMLDDPDRVKLLEHHPIVNCLPEARGRFSFILDNDAAPVPIDSMPRINCDSLDLRDDLMALINRMIECGFDVLVVDQTMPEIAGHELACVKVMCPGLVPISFGHAARRTENLPRLSGAAPLPYESRLLPGEEPGATPHPFD